MSEYPSDFMDWYDSHEWWKSPIEELWEAYVMLGGPNNHHTVARAMDIIISAASEEFGE